MLKNLMKGNFFGHPLHSMLVHFPVGLWVASLGFDIAFKVGGNTALTVASYYCLKAGLILAVITALTGLIELRHVPRRTRAFTLAITHLGLNLLVTALYVPNYVIRNGADGAIPNLAFVLSILSVLLLSVSGYIGGLLAYRYGMGHRPELREPEKKPSHLRRVA